MEDLLKELLDYRPKELTRLHEEIKKKYKIDVLFLPEKIKRALEEKINKSIFVFYGRYGSGKTALLTASYLYLKEKNERDYYIGNALEIVKEESRNSYPGIFLDELHRAVLEAREKDIERLGHIIREYFEEYKPTVLTTKEPDIIDVPLTKVGASIPETKIEKINLDSQELRTEIVRFLYDRNLKLIGIVYGEKLKRKLKEKLDPEIESRIYRLRPRLVNLGILGATPEIDLDFEDGIRKELEHSIRRFAERFYKNMRFIVTLADGTPIEVRAIEVDASRDRGADAEIVLGIYLLSKEPKKDALDAIRIGIEVKAGKGKLINTSQMEEFLSLYDGLFYFLFSKSPKSIELKEKRVDYVNFPFYLSYIASKSERTRYLSAYFSEERGLKDLVKKVLELKGIKIPEAEKEASREDLIDTIVRILAERGEDKIKGKGKIFTKIRKDRFAEMLSNDYKNVKFDVKSLDEFLRSNIRDINKKLEKFGYTLRITKKEVHVRPKQI